MITAQRRLPRFSRDQQNIRAIQLTSRDHDIIQCVARHRFLRSTHVCALVSGAPKQIIRRLQFLYHHGYLERPRSQLDYYHLAGSSPIVYGLGSRGAALMRHVFNTPFHCLDWSTKNQKTGRLFLEHVLMIADVLVPLEKACRDTQGAIRFVSAAQLESTANGGFKRGVCCWSIPLPDRWYTTLIPDAVFALEQTDAQGKVERVLYFLEADRGTMPVVRSNPRQTSFARKLEAYASSWASGVMQRHFGMERCRVLTVTSSMERSRNLVAATQSLPRGRGLFLFTDANMLSSTESALAHSWAMANGASAALL